MSNPTPIGADKNFSLADLNTFVAQQEGVLGPLTAMSNNGNQTVLTFDTDPPTPANPPVIAPDQNGQSVIPAGSTKVCQGSFFIAGTATPATASRAN